MSGSRLQQVALMAALAGLIVACPILFFAYGNPEKPFDARFSDDGRFLALATERGIGVFGIQTGEAQSLPGWGHLAFSPDGSLLGCGGNADLTVWNWRERRKLHSWSGTNRWAFRLAISPDGTKVAGADDRSLRVWDLGTGQLLDTIPLAFEHDYVGFSTDGQFVVTGGTETKAAGVRTHDIRLWTVPGGRLHATLAGPESCIVRSLAVSPDGRSIAVGSSINSVRLWDIEGRKELWKADDVGTDYGTLAFSADGKWIASGCGETVTLLNAAGPTAKKMVGVDGGRVGAIVSANVPGKFLVVAGTRIHEVDASSRSSSTLRGGIKVRSDVPFWATGLGFLAWAVAWRYVHRRLLQRMPEAAHAAERYLWSVVMVTACLSVLHWCFLLITAWGNWAGTSPISLLGFLAFSWLPAIVLVILMGIFYSRHPASLVGSGLCVLALTGQMLFELWLLNAVIASV